MHFDQISLYYDQTAGTWANQYVKKYAIMHPAVKIPQRNQSRIRAARFLEETMIERAEAMDAVKIFDLGCGFASSMLYAANIRSGTTFSGICSSDTELELARHRIREAGKVQSVMVFRGDFEDARNYRVFSAQDIVFAFDSFRHTRDAAVLFGLLSNLVRPAGRLIIADWFRTVEQPAEATPAAKLLEGWRINSGLACVMSLDNSLSLAEQAGFTLLENQSQGSRLALSMPRRVSLACGAAVSSKETGRVHKALLCADSLRQQGIMDYRILEWQRT